MKYFVYSILLVCLMAALLPAKKKRTSSNFSKKSYELSNVKQFVNMRELEVRNKNMDKAIIELQTKVDGLTKQLEQNKASLEEMNKKIWKVDFITKAIKSHLRWVVFFALLIIIIPAVREFTMFKKLSRMNAIVDELHNNPPVRIKSEGGKGPVVEGGPDSKLSL